MTKYSITSFTHNGEDIILWRGLSKFKNGFYIDIGANDPVINSTTKLFYDNGWSGINCEPDESYLERLRKERPRDHNLGVAVSDKLGSLDFYVVGSNGLSSIDVEQARSSAAGVHPAKMVTVPTETLAAIWERFVPKGQEVYFLKIDVEGAEKKVVAGANWKRHRPWTIVIESTILNNSIPSHQEWESKILAADYLFVYFDGVNRYYVAKEHGELVSAFNRPVNPMVDNFKPFLAELVERGKQNEIDALTFEKARISEELKEAESNLSVIRQAYDALERHNSDLSWISKRLQEEQQLIQLATELRQDMGSLLHQVNLLSKRNKKKKGRRFFEKIVFRKDGRPKSLFRRLLFHTNGKPRRAFRSLVISADGTPHLPFRKWMASYEYQRLQKSKPWRENNTISSASVKRQRFEEASGFGETVTHDLPGHGLSPRTLELLALLEDRIVERDT